MKRLNDNDSDTYDKRNNENVLSDLKPLQVKVGGNFEESVRRFKSLFQKEKIVGKYKEKQSYEKPSDKKRRKTREAAERRIMLEQRDQMIRSGEWDKRNAKKLVKKQRKANQRSQAEGTTVIQEVK